MKKTTNFDSKIKAYSTMALCIAGAGVANAQIVYTDVNPDVVLTANADSIIIDFNADLTNDYVIKRFDWSGNPANTAVIMPPALGNAAMGTMGTTIPYLSALAAGAAIDGTVTTWIVNDGSSPQLAKMGLASVYSGVNYGNFGDGLDHYIGCKFLIGTNTHYGWIRVNTPLGGATGTVYDYAYNSTPDAPITAGQLAVGINNTPEIQSNIYSFNKNVHVNFSTPIDGKISVYNNIGELILTEEINGMKKLINLSSQASGIYMIRVESLSGSFTKKVNL
ncbi:MAG: T9SS type A sorting domain-containing protein [Bacteroidetes bacterium]|nr:T9SS type A sorting domain-containing protein [Bacteroidota bacterium]